ncbi:MAG: hypothetical protein V1813_02890 [Candidatus Aenigmatarchaeota archaeon]
MGDSSGDTPPCFFQQFRPRYLDVNVPEEMKSKPPYICVFCRYGEGEDRDCHTRKRNGHSVKSMAEGVIISLNTQEPIPQEYRDKILLTG